MTAGSPWCLDVITVVTEPARGIALTANSLVKAAEGSPDQRLRWLVVESDAGPSLTEALRTAESCDNIDVVCMSRVRDGIFTAMNQALEHVAADRFMFLNSGDVLLLPLRYVRALPDSASSKVVCFEAGWHDDDMRPQPSRQWMRFSPQLAVMPNHHAMVFSSELVRYRYRTDLPVSADQDLKLRLWREGVIVRDRNVLSSCLAGGISMQPLTVRGAYRRYAETRRVLQSHFGFLHAELVSLIYLVRYGARIRRTVPGVAAAVEPALQAR